MFEFLNRSVFFTLFQLKDYSTFFISCASDPRNSWISFNRILSWLYFCIVLRPVRGVKMPLFSPKKTHLFFRVIWKYPCVNLKLPENSPNNSQRFTWGRFYKICLTYASWVPCSVIIEIVGSYNYVMYQGGWCANDITLKRRICRISRSSKYC